MSIGLFDQDINTFLTAPFNLEIMKLSTYYKSKKELVGFAPVFDPDRYTKIIYRKDYDDGCFNKKLLKYDNVDYGGLSFTNNQYISLPIEIERCKPDVDIYNNYIDTAPLIAKDIDRYKVMKNAAHLRLSLDGKTVWDEYLTPINWPSDAKQAIFIHDYNITEIEESYEAIQTILTFGDSKVTRFVNTKFPLIVYNYEDLIKWLKLPLGQNCIIEYRGLMKNEDVIKLLDLPQTKLSHIHYDPTYDSKDEEDFCKNRLQKVYKQLIFLRSHKKYLSLIYSASILTDPLWVVVFSELTDYWASIKNITEEELQYVLRYDSFYHFIVNTLKSKNRFTVKKFTKETVKEAFQLVYEKDYSTFVDFYECLKVKYEGGEFV